MNGFRITQAVMQAGNPLERQVELERSVSIDCSRIVYKGAGDEKMVRNYIDGGDGERVRLCGQQRCARLEF